MIGKYFVLLITIGAVAAVQRIPVTIYYETLCQDSMNFYTKQFTPTWRDLKDYIQLTLVPYGKSKATVVPAPQNATFECNHGPNECMGNKYQSCLLLASYNIDIDTQVYFIDCLMSSATKDKDYALTGRDCQSKVHGVDAVITQHCASSFEGNTLLLQNGRKTDQLQNPLEYVPTIVFNDHYDKAESKAAETSFRSALCKHITETPKPKACESSGAPITTVGVITLFATCLVARFL